jgi:hypothetical protein
MAAIQRTVLADKDLTECVKAGDKNFQQAHAMVRVLEASPLGHYNETPEVSRGL